MINVALWAAGVVLLLVAIWRVRGPWARMSELDHLAENARRYESWRGGRGVASGDETTGADIMRQLLRRQVSVWVGVGILGVLLILAGFAIR